MTTTPQETLVYSINDAATAAGISRGTIYNAIAANELTPLKIGRRTGLPRVEEDDQGRGLTRSPKQEKGPPDQGGPKNTTIRREPKYEHLYNSSRQRAQYLRRPPVDAREQRDERRQVRP